MEAIKYLGGKCGCTNPACFHPGASCDVSDERVLTFNHKRGKGGGERKPGYAYTFFRQIAQGKRPDIELLCANCHMIHTKASGVWKGRPKKYAGSDLIGK